MTVITVLRNMNKASRVQYKQFSLSGCVNMCNIWVEITKLH